MPHQTYFTYLLDVLIVLLLTCWILKPLIVSFLRTWSTKLVHVTPKKVDPRFIWLADSICNDYWITLSPYLLGLHHNHVCDIAFHIVPTLTHGMLLGMEWFSSFSLVVDWTLRIVTLTIDGESLELKCVMP